MISSKRVAMEELKFDILIIFDWKDVISKVETIQGMKLKPLLSALGLDLMIG